MALSRQQIQLVMGFSATGDFGPFTAWTTRKGKIALALKAWLKDPESPSQAAHRARFRAAMQDWNRLTPEAKQNWQTVCRRLNLIVTGTSLWTHWHMSGDDDGIRTVEDQSGIQLLPPDYE